MFSVFSNGLRERRVSFGRTEDQLSLFSCFLFLNNATQLTTLRPTHSASFVTSVFFSRKTSFPLVYFYIYYVFLLSFIADRKPKSFISRHNSRQGPGKEQTRHKTKKRTAAQFDNGREVCAQTDRHNIWFC